MAIPRRQALAIGINAYTGTDPLDSCVNDATDMSNCLRSIGFEVHTRMDPDYYSLQRITQKFIRSIQPGAIVILYYSGHGVQYGGYNFLVPTDIDPGHIKESALSAERLIEDIHLMSPRVVIVILDSCRTFWGPGSLLRTRRADRMWSGIRVGLAPMRVPPATIVAYASAAETAASQFSRNGRNSMYTYHLLRHIATPNVDIDYVLRNVAINVQKDSNNEQIPYRYSSCNENICLVVTSGKNVPAWSGFMKSGAAFCKSLSINMLLAPFKNPFSKMDSKRYPRPSISHHQNPWNYQFYKPKRHHSTYMYDPSKVMRYPLMRPLYYRR
jgi:uncharacterized caspase-like protein